LAETNQSPFEIQNFSGGITDDVFEQDYTSSASIDNFVVTSDQRLKTRPGSVIDDDTNGQIPAGISRVSALINYKNNDQLFYVNQNHVYYRDPSAFTTLQGPTGNEVFSVGTTSSAPSFSQWNGHLFVTNDSYPSPMKIYKDENGDYQVRSSGMPALASNPTVTAGAVGTRSYIYAFHYEYTYFVFDQEFQDVGPVTFVSLTLSDDPSVNANAIAAIPTLANGATENHDTANLKVFIYRTIDGGQILYKIGEVTNGTAVFNDNFSDSSIQTNLILYTDDGTLDFDPPPRSKYVHVVNNTGYYLNIYDGSETYPYRLHQSIPGDPDSAPQDFYIDLEDEGRGMSSVKSVPIALCKRFIYRIEQFFDQFGRGAMNPIRISDTVGCVSNLSLVQAENYLFWAGNDGFYATDGYQLIKLSDRINDKYKELLAAQTNTNFIYGKFDEKERRIYWGIQSDTASMDNDSLIVFDLRWGIKTNGCFTTWSGESFAPSSLEYYDGKLYRGDKRGYTFIHDDQYLTDPLIDTGELASDWYEETIIWTWQSININFGSTFFRKMPTRILLTANNIANTTIQITAINDAGKKTRDLKLIRWRRNFVWGDDDFTWGNPDCVWGGTGIIEQWRRFPAGGLRTSYISMVVTNGFGVVTNSDTAGLGTLDGSLKTITLPVTSVWPSQPLSYVISTSDDNYQREFTVSQRNSDQVLTVLDPTNSFPTGSYQWLLSGYKKQEPLYLLGVNIFWENLSQTQNTYESGQDGGNA
jgi:hypothetical protein